MRISGYFGTGSIFNKNPRRSFLFHTWQIFLKKNAEEIFKQCPKDFLEGLSEEFLKNSWGGQYQKQFMEDFLKEFLGKFWGNSWRKFSIELLEIFRNEF